MKNSDNFPFYSGGPTKSKVSNVNYVVPFKQIHGIVNSLFMDEVASAILICGINNTGISRRLASK